MEMSGRQLECGSRLVFVGKPWNGESDFMSTLGGGGKPEEKVKG